jgi:hypothetical protein
MKYETLMKGPNVRTVKEDDVKVTLSYLRGGWNYSHSLVITNTLLDETKPEGTEHRYWIVDGAHRFTAIGILRQDKDEQIRNKWLNFEVPCVILNSMTKSDALAYSFS